MKVLPRKLIVKADANEQKPVLFPETLVWNPPSLRAAHTFVVPPPQTIRLRTGDYCLKGFEENCVIERKGSIAELRKNLCTSDRVRALKAFDRLAECSYPVVLLDFHPTESFKVTEHCENPRYVIDCFFDLVRSRGLHVVWGGGMATPSSRRHLGELLLRLMLSVNYSTL